MLINKELDEIKKFRADCSVGVGLNRENVDVVKNV